MTATGNTNEFIMANTDKTAVEIEWKLDTPVREESCVIIGLTRKNPVKSMGCEVESYFFDQKNRYSEAA